MKNNYKLKIICMLCVVTAAFSSCKKSELAEEKKLTNNHNNFAYTGHPKYHFLGYGYDITGRVASAESAKLSVLNVDKFVTENPGLFKQNDDVNDYFEYSYGENAESYSKKLTQKYKLTLDLNFLKVAKLFRGELNASFAKKDSASAKYIYATVRKMIRQRSMKIVSTTENLINNYLTEQFKSDLISLSATALVERYGTHVLTDIELGARLDMNYESQTNNSKREEAATAGANISVGKYFNVTADLATNSVDASSNYNQKLFYNSVGGDGTKSLVGEIALDNSTIKINIGNWQSSCNKDNAALIKIAEDGLIALEDLISDPTKKQQVKVAVEQYILDRQIKLSYAKLQLYNFYSNQLGHIFTVDASFSNTNPGWRRIINDPIYVYDSQKPGTVPVYIMQHRTASIYCLTRDNTIDLDIWAPTNYPVFYAYENQATGTFPVHQFYHPNKFGDGYFYDLTLNPTWNGWIENTTKFYAFKNAN